MAVGADAAPGWRGLSTILSASVDEEGRLHWPEVQRRADDVEALAIWIAKPRPARQRRAIGRRAFYLNAFDALVWLAALRRWPDGALPDDPWSVLRGDEVWMDGHPIRLQDLEQHLIRLRLQDHRFESVLHRLGAEDPPWSKSALSEATIDREVTEAMIRWLADDERGLVIRSDGLEVPAALARRQADVEIQTGGEGLCDVLIRHSLGAQRLALQAERARGCRWAPRNQADGKPIR